MSEALDAARKRNRYDVTLPSGTNVTLRLPKQLEYVATMRAIPTPILDSAREAAAESNGDGADVVQRLTFEEQLEIATQLDALVNITVVAYEGRELEPGEPIADELAEEDCLEIVAYAQRSKPLPKASGPTTSEPFSPVLGPGSTARAANGTGSILQPSSTTTSSP